VNTGTNSVSQDIVFGAPGDYYIYPAVRTDASGDVYVSLSRTNASIFPEARATGRRFSDPQNTMSGSALMGAGEVIYNGFRWGDYMGAAVDPNFPECVCLVSEYSKNIPCPEWGTYIAASSYSGGCDGDDDKWTDGAEGTIGTDPLDACADNGSDNAWPADFTNNTFVDTADLAQLSSRFGLQVLPSGTEPPRYDLAPDPPNPNPDLRFVDTADVARLTALFGQGCGP